MVRQWWRKRIKAVPVSDEACRVRASFFRNATRRTSTVRRFSCGKESCATTPENRRWPRANYAAAARSSCFRRDPSFFRAASRSKLACSMADAHRDQKLMQKHFAGMDIGSRVTRRSTWTFTSLPMSIHICT